MMHGKIYDSLSDIIGNTPLLRLNRLRQEEGFGANVIAKLEFFNPLGSVKDRIGLAMIEEAERHGAHPSKTKFVEPTSGNTGIALAFVAAAKGYDITLVMPESMSLERRKLLKFLGATLKLSPADKGMAGAIAIAKDLVSQGYVELGQFYNPANPKIHEKTTAQEILKDTDAKVDVFIAGVGTGGTIHGVGKVLKQHNADIKVIAVEPEDSSVLSGGAPGPHKIQGIGAGFIPDNYNPALVDEIIKIGNDVAFDTSRHIAKLEGIPLGISSGATVAAAVKVAHRPALRDKNIVVMTASCAERYLSTPLFGDM